MCIQVRKVMARRENATNCTGMLARCDHHSYAVCSEWWNGLLRSIPSHDHNTTSVSWGCPFRLEYFGGEGPTCLCICMYHHYCLAVLPLPVHQRSYSLCPLALKSEHLYYSHLAQWPLYQLPLSGQGIHRTPTAAHAPLFLAGASWRWKEFQVSAHK